MKPGTRVFDIADPRFIGHVERVTRGADARTRVRWEDDGTVSYVRTDKLRIAEPDSNVVPLFPWPNR